MSPFVRLPFITLLGLSTLANPVNGEGAQTEKIFGYNFAKGTTKVYITTYRASFAEAP